MNRLKLHIIFIVLVSNALFAQCQDSLSLNQFLDLAMIHNINVKNASWNLEQAILDNKIFNTQFKPQVSARAILPNFSKTFRETVQPNGTLSFRSISYNNSNASIYGEQIIGGTGARVFAETGLQRFDDFDQGSTSYNGFPIRVGIIQPILGFNPYKWDKQIEEVKLVEASKSMISDIEQVKLEAGFLFFDLLNASINYTIAKNNNENTKTLYSIAEKKYELGKISKGDLLQLELVLLSSAKDKNNAFQNLKFQSANIKSFLGREYQDEVIFPITPTPIQNLILDSEFALEEALLNREEFNSFDRILLESKREVDQRKKENGINVDLTASVGFIRSSDKIQEIYTDPQNEQLARVTIGIPILNWGRNKVEKKLANIKLEQNQAFINNEKVTLLNDVQKIIQNFKYLQGELQVVEEIKTLSQQRFEISKESFILGAISITNLNIAQQEKDNALRTYINTLQNYWTSYLQIRRVCLYDFEKQEKLIYKF